MGVKEGDLSAVSRKSWRTKRWTDFKIELFWRSKDNRPPTSQSPDFSSGGNQPRLEKIATRWRYISHYCYCLSVVMKGLLQMWGTLKTAYCHCQGIFIVFGDSNVQTRHGRKLSVLKKDAVKVNWSTVSAEAAVFFKEKKATHGWVLIRCCVRWSFV